MTRKPQKRLLALGSISALALIGLPAAGATAANDGSQRIAGNDRIATAIAVKKSYTGWGDTAILARADQFADSLGGSALSAALKAPIFLTGSNEVDVRVGANLREGGFKKVIMLGGSNALAPQVQSDVQASGYQVERLSGASRYETSLQIAQQVVAKTGKSQVLLTSGENFPDALTAGAAAATSGAAVVLTRSGGVDGEVKDFLTKTGAQVTTVGGPATRAAQASGIKVNKAIVGKNRYATAAAVAQAFFPQARGAVLASGVDFPDALAAAAVAGIAGQPLLLATPQGAPAETVNYLRQANIAAGSIKVVGGEKAVKAEPSHPTKPANPTKPDSDKGSKTPGYSRPWTPGSSGRSGGSAPAPNPGGSAPAPAPNPCDVALPNIVLNSLGGNAPKNVNDTQTLSVKNMSAYNAQCDIWKLEAIGNNASAAPTYISAQFDSNSGEATFKLIKISATEADYVYKLSVTRTHSSGAKEVKSVETPAIHLAASGLVAQLVTSSFNVSAGGKITLNLKNWDQIRGSENIVYIWAEPDSVLELTKGDSTIDSATPELTVKSGAPRGRHQVTLYLNKTEPEEDGAAKAPITITVS